MVAPDIENSKSEKVEGRSEQQDLSPMWGLRFEDSAGAEAAQLYSAAVKNLIEEIFEHMERQVG